MHVNRTRIVTSCHRSALPAHESGPDRHISNFRLFLLFFFLTDSIDELLANRVTGKILSLTSILAGDLTAPRFHAGFRRSAQILRHTAQIGTMIQVLGPWHLLERAM